MRRDAEVETEALPDAAAARRGTASRPLRFRLFLLAASGLAPLALVLLVASVYLARDRGDDAQQAAVELSRALATAVDAELRSTVSLLENLAVTADLQDLEPEQLSGEEFALLARRVMQSQHWILLTVANDRGEILLREPPSASMSRSPVEPSSLAETVRSRAPVIGPVATAPDGRDTFAVRIPVVKDDRVRYVLSGVVSTRRVLDVVARQQVAPSWVLAVYDQAGTQVARSRPTGARRYSASLEALVRSGGPEGVGIARTLEGVESHTGFSHVRLSQWVVAVGIPAAEANADVYRLLAAVSAGTAASLGLLALLAWRMASAISAPIDRLKRAASDLGVGEHVELPALGVAELDEVAWALRQAAIDRDDANERRSKVEQEREQLLVRLEEALRVAEEANRNKDEFLALLGHELRNPLAPIMNAVHLLGLKGDERTLPERRIIHRQLNYVTRLVDDLLDASRITSKRFAIKMRPLRPVPVLEQTVESLRPSFGTRTVNLRIEEGTRGLWVNADEARLVQVFNNLLGNAIKFTAATGTIDVEAAARERWIDFTVRDDGVGMNPLHLRRAFDLFYQAPNRARGVSGGLGLGLAIVKSLVEMHGGSVRAASDGPDHGTAVVVSLPVTEPLPEDAAVPRARAGAGTTRVLVVDDNEDAADTLSMLLEASGFPVQVAYTAQSALAAVEAFRPEVVILDIGLPDIDGYQLARRLRSGVQPYRGKLVALTGYGQAADVERAMAAGFDAHLTKPVEPDTLLGVLAKVAATPG